MSASSASIVPPPRRQSPHLLTMNGDREDPSASRSSFDTLRQQGEASSSRRPSTSSTHHSPQSTSSGRRVYETHTAKEEKNAWHGEGNGNEGHSARLPRITTSNVDRRRGEDEEDGGPKSAPAYGQLRSLHGGVNGAGGSNGPLRSSSSPDPWHERYQRDSPNDSPTEHRPNIAAGPPILGSPYTASGARRPSPANLPPHQIPPRTSSHTDLQDRGVTSQTSHSSLSSGAQTPVQLSDLPGSISSQSSTPRSRGRGDPTYCGQCGQLVHGQFVRAMSKVYHLNCFRCKVRSR